MTDQTTMETFKRDDCLGPPGRACVRVDAGPPMGDRGRLGAQGSSARCLAMGAAARNEVL